MVIVGFASGKSLAIKANYLLIKNIAVPGLQWSDYRNRSPERVRAAQQRIFAWWQTGRLDPFISQFVPLHRFAEVLTRIRDGVVEGKIVLVRKD